jgi:serine/threonine protein kinase/tetratricopeptide (TPR) repeat protein
MILRSIQGRIPCGTPSFVQDGQIGVKERVGMKDRSPVFGSDPEQIDKLLAWPLDAAVEDQRTVSLEQFTEAPGGQIGRYKLLRVLGEGGMGIVYLAEQHQPIRRKVALKVIKPGMDSKRVIARFEAEQQALALMNHPYVARVYDAGVAPSGHPYFVMEHVSGIPITEHCDKYQLTVEKRLALFLHVCEAIQHAHQKGIIHRDLKSSNILVALQDEEAVPKVIDFGVARALSQPLTERTLYTEQGQLVGTPEYMSPEQADPENADIDIRTDVYSLGVLLYELLTGVLPFDRETFREGGIDHIRKVICEQDPPTPSTRLSRTSVAESAESARRRRTDVRTLQHKLRGDLDWITLKAMEKDRTRRYASVDAMATDVRNYLNHQPVSAAPPGTVYRLKKFIRRHRQMITAGTVILLMLTVVIWAVRTYVQAGRQRAYVLAVDHERALEEAREAFDTRSFSAAQSAVVPLLGSPQVGLRAKLLYAQLLLENQEPTAAISELESLLNAPKDIAGQAHSLLATIYYHEAFSSPEEAPEPIRRWRYHLAEAEKLIGGTAQGYFLKACGTSNVREKLDLLGKALEQDRRHYDSLRERAYIYLAQHDYESLLRDATLMMGIESDNPQGYFLSATALRELGRCEEALVDHRAAIDLDPNDPKLYLARWETYTRMGRHEAALPDIRKCVELEPEDTLHPVKLCATLTALGRYDEADNEYRRYIERPDLDQGFGTHCMGKEGKILFYAQSVKVTFDYLACGLSPCPSENPPQGAAYYGMYVGKREFEANSRDGHRVVAQGSHPSWSPDGTKLLYTMGFARTNAVAMLDLQTGRTEVLTIPGKDPEWSPDGRRIAFVRARTLLPPQRLASLGVETWRSGYMPTENDEVWIMEGESRTMRRIGEGGYPHWGQQSGLLYYTSRLDYTLYSISVERENAHAQVVLRDCSAFPTVSPDERYVADHRFRELRIIDVSNGEIVRRWLTPPRPRPGLFVHWSPDGRELSVCGWDGSEMGLWIYNMETQAAVKIMSAYYATTARWSGGKQPKLAIGFGLPLTEIWICDLKPNAPTAESFHSVQTVEEHCRWLIGAPDDNILAMDPGYVDTHYLRVDCALWIGHERTQEFLEAFDAALTPEYYSAWGISGFCSLVLNGAPEIQTRLMPMVSLLARKAVEKEPGCVRVLAPQFYRAGYHDQAYEIFKAYPNPESGHSRYDQATATYTVTGVGVDIWEFIDDFHFAPKSLQGDGSITARIDSIENVNEWTKAGVMIRSSLDPTSENVMVFVTPSGRVAFQHRHTQAAMTYSAHTPVDTVQLPHWVRLTRRSNRFLGEHSCDGIHWQTVLPSSDPNRPASIEIPMNETVYLGLAVTSHDATKTAEAHVSHVTVTGVVTPTGPFNESRDIGFPLPPLPTAAK